MSQVACPHCQAVVDASGFAPGTEVACGVCGGVMMVGEARPHAPRRRTAGGRAGPAGRRQSHAEKSHLNREMKRAITAVLGIRILYIFFAVLTGLLAVFVLIKFRAAGVVGQPLALAILALLFGLTALYVVGAILIHAQPMLWSILIAVLQTIGALNGLTDGFSGPDLVTIGSAAGCWIAVAVISSAKKTFDRYGGMGGGRSAVAGRGRGRAATRRTRRRMA